jgi:hypothetical protein
MGNRTNAPSHVILEKNWSVGTMAGERERGKEREREGERERDRLGETERGREEMCCTLFFFFFAPFFSF